MSLQLAAEMYLKAPDRSISQITRRSWDYCQGNAFLIGKVVDDGQPLIVNLKSDKYRVVSFTSCQMIGHAWKDFVKALAYGIEEQFKPFSAGAKVSYAVITYYAMEWADTAKAETAGRIPLISTGTERGPAVQIQFMEKHDRRMEKQKIRPASFSSLIWHDLAQIPDKA